MSSPVKPMINKLAVVVPVYQQRLDALDELSLTHSLSLLSTREIIFVGPKNLDISYYREHFGNFSYFDFDTSHFESLISYSSLLLSKSFYERFSNFEFILVLQPDAIILKDDLDYWMNQPYDYIGAPWPDVVTIKLRLARYLFRKKSFSFFVGNGGLSLRRVNNILLLIDELKRAQESFVQKGVCEDIFFGLGGCLSKTFKVPDSIVASRFSLELKPTHFFTLNGGCLPMGGHAWLKYEPEFWRAHIPFKF